MNIAFATPSARAATLYEIVPGATAFPAAIDAAAWIVGSTSELALPTDAAFSHSHAASEPAVTASPLPASRALSNSRARVRRVEIVPFEQPRCRPASS
jgi:hypothetical protein